MFEPCKRITFSITFSRREIKILKIETQKQYGARRVVRCVCKIIFLTMSFVKYISIPVLKLQDARALYKN